MAMQTVTVAAQLDLDLQLWRTINDDVMGGVSRGEIITIDNGLRFRGQVSLQNNGGFTSARMSYGGSPISAGQVRLRVKGDGRRYQFRVRLDDRYDGVAWRAGFDTNESWQTVTLPFEEFESVYRGRAVTNAGSLVPEKIRQIGFLLADKKEGPFQLDFTSIEFPIDE
jgi:NADH dehydrogenase [ubiquinone] 1 alpha subcomplex assembly factor 1